MHTPFTTDWATSALQMVDVMVHPQYRGILKRKGPFFMSAAFLLEGLVGDGKEFPLAFGFPSAKHNRLGSLLGLYEEVEAIKQVSWNPLNTRPRLRIKTRPLGIDQQAIADGLWRRMADALKDRVIGVRDWAYLQRRYLHHPTHQYQLFLVSSRLTGRALGIYVIRMHSEAIELMDVIAAPAEIPDLIFSLRRLSHHLNTSLIYAWISSQQAPLLAGKTGEISDTEIRVPHCHWTPGIAADRVRNRWWLMGGDTDFR